MCHLGIGGVISLALEQKIAECSGMYMIKRSGPSTKPWVTPKRSLMGLDWMDEI